MFLFLNLLKKKPKPKTTENKLSKPTRNNEQIAGRKGELGEFKIDIQLDQMPKEYRHLSDLLVKNSKTESGYSQIDHVLITPYGIFVIETKNYQGKIYGGKNRKNWSVNGKFKMMNPFQQNHGHIKAIESLIDQKFKDIFISMVSFTKRCTFKMDMDYRKINSDKLIIYDIEFSEYIKRKVLALKREHKQPLLQEEDIKSIYNTLSSAHISDPEILEEHKRALKAKNDTANQAKCSICNKPVSDKVKTFCLSNKKFNGKIYCFEHQKSI